MDKLLTGVWTDGDGRVVLELTGEIDLASELAFRGYVHMLADGTPAVLDFAGVEFMDSTGIGPSCGTANVS